jgi:signal transduction histidine kinase
MDWKFICGILTAEATAQLGLAVTLAYAFWRVRLEVEHLIFAVLCGSIALQSIASAWWSWPGFAEPILASVMVHSIMAIAAAIHLHYVVALARVRKPHVPILVGYGIAAVFVLLMASPAVWPMKTLALLADRSHPYAFKSYPLLAVPPVALVYGFYGASLIEFAYCLWALAVARRHGRKDVTLIMVGILVVAAAAVHDLTLMVNAVNGLPLLTHSVERLPLLTHSFSIYGFCVGLSLLARYRRLVLGYATTESSLHARTEELRKSYADLEQIQRELSSKKELAAVGELAAAIAHEVRNPLAIIVNAVAGLRRPSLQEQDRHMLLGIVDEETARLNRLVTDLLRFARPVSIRRSSVALAELVRRAESNRGSEYQFEIHIPDDPELRTVQADANLLRLVFDNLVANACQSMPEGGTVRIIVAEGRLSNERCVMIEIIDHGHGMDGAVLSRAVDPFFTTRPSGTGLGLPIVQRIVAAHGGVLEMESEPQQGTTARLLLPCITEDFDATNNGETGARP